MFRVDEVSFNRIRIKHSFMRMQIDQWFMEGTECEAKLASSKQRFWKWNRNINLSIWRMSTMLWDMNNPRGKMQAGSLLTELKIEICTLNLVEIIYNSKQSPEKNDLLRI